MISQDEARARVARGAAHLDTVKPGWHARIDTGTLTLHDPCGCIIGQLTGDRSFDYESLGMTALTVNAFGCQLPADEMGGAWGRDRDDPAVRHCYQSLQDAWIEAIAARLHPVREAIPTETPVTA